MDENMDLSKAFEKVQEMLSDENGEGQLQNLISMLSGSGNSDSSEAAQSSGGIDLSSLLSGSTNTESEGGASFDFNTIMKLQGILSAMNQQKVDTNSAFLNSLKPLLKKDRRDKVDQAVKIMSITKAFKLFKDIDKGGV